MRKRLKKYQPPLRVIRHCGRISCDDDTGCPFFVGGYGYFCGHPHVEKNRGKEGIPDIPSVSFYGRIPGWCPLTDHTNPNECDGEYTTCKGCEKKYKCEWSQI